MLYFIYKFSLKYFASNFGNFQIDIIIELNKMV